MKRASLFFFLICAFLPVATRAQVQTGTFPFGSFSGQPDTVDLANLNSIITIPIVNKQGRGLNFSYDTFYNSAVWYPVTSGSSKVWQPVENWGFSGSLQAAFGYVNMETIVSDPCYAGSLQNLHQTGTRTTYYWSYIDAKGAGHSFGNTTLVTGTCSGYSTTSIDVTASDGSGYTFSATGDTVNSLYNSDGQLINVPVNSPGSGSATLTDRNGNFISSNGSGVFTDTLGTTALTIAGSGTPSSPITYTYTAPSGANAVYTEKFTSYTVETNFGCSGISEFGPTSENLVSEIDLPDIGIASTDKYTITYEATPGHSGDVTGRIASITLPTGGTISYSYSGGSNGITCADGSTATLTRTTPDGTWTYAHSESGTAWTTTITDPQGNQTAYNFQGVLQTERQAYSGSSTLLKTVFTCYNGASPNCNSTAITAAITSVARYVQWPSGLEKETLTDYNSYGLSTQENDYDYGSSGPGSLLRKTLISYASLGNDIVDMPASVTVQNGSGGTVAETTYQYDQGSLNSPPGTTPQIVSVSGSRGNATTVSYLVSSSTFLSKTFSYYNTGGVDVATDVNGGQTTYNYANATSTCGNAFPSSVTEAVSGLSQSMTWNCTGGVETSLTDENGQTVSASYTDAYYWRSSSSTDQLGNQTGFSYYPNSNYPTVFAVVASMTFNSGNSIASDYQYEDSLGRTYVDQHIESPSSSTLDSISYTFDANGRPASTSGPCAITWSSTCSGPTTTQTYDTLNRPLVTTDGGGGTATFSYSANDVLQTIGPAPSGENTKQRQSQYNGIGQLTSVCEVTGLTGSGTCAQSTSATGYWTEYTYDVLGDLLSVTQNVQSSSSQSRSYTFDGLGRMLSETNPETGTKYYFFDTDPGTKGGANCSGTYDGDLVKRVDAVGNVTCYTYDKLHRVTSVTYPYGSNSSNTPSKCFVYDAAIDNQTVTNPERRLAEAYTTTSACSSTNLPATITDEAFSYTARGEITTAYESTPHSSGYLWVTQSYWANGAPNSENNNLSGVPAITNGADGEGRVSTVSAGSGQNPVTSTSYNVASEATQVNLGSADNDAFSFDPNTFRMTQYSFNINGQSVTGVLTWNANWSLGKLAITDAFNSTNTQTCTYTHDDLARIASGNCGSVWSQTFSYDAFGNLTKTGSSQFQPTYSYLTNQMSSIGSFTPSYDANGDVTNDSLNSYAWDVEGRPTTIDGITVTYDALERLVEQDQSGSYTQIVYDCLGNKLALMNTASTEVKSFVPLPGGGTAVYAPGGLQYYRHPDWLGSSRFASTPSRTMYNDLAYAPFGEQYASTGTMGVTNTSFARMNQNIATSVYDAMYREYGIQGRWPSPDPAGMAAANPANPQSWNRYAYVLNKPLTLVDPNGMGVECIGGTAFDVESTYSDGQLVDTTYTPLGSCPDGGGGDQSGGGGGGNGSPQTPTPHQPQKKPCPAASRAASTVEALDAAGDAVTSFSLGAAHFGAAFVLVSAGCLEPTPAEPLTCAAAGFGGLSLSAGGAVLTGFGVFQTKRAFSAIKQAFTCGPGS